MDRCAQNGGAVAEGWIAALHPGVYLLGAAPPDWWQQQLAAVFAAGPDSMAARRAGLLVWGLEGIASAPVEVNAPHNGNPRPRGAIVHRTRRIEPVSMVKGIPVTSVERTLLEVGAVVPPVVVEKAFSSAWRRNLTSPEKCDLYLQHHGGKGQRGTPVLREVVAL